MVGAGDDSEEHWIGMRHHWPAGDLRNCRRGNVAEEEVGDIAFEDDDLAVAGQNAGEHADGALKDGDHSEHCRDAEGDAGDADEGANAMALEIGHNQLEKDHLQTPGTVAQAFPVANDEFMLEVVPQFAKEAQLRSCFQKLAKRCIPELEESSEPQIASGTPIACAALGRSRSRSRATVLPASTVLSSTSLRSSTIWYPRPQ